jgi:glycosyltransferase involved in cell wall biosynthesis
MKICFDLSPAVDHRAGIGRYTHELVTALTALDSAQEYRAFYTAPRGDERPDPPLDRLPMRALRLTARAWRLRVLLAHLAGVTLDRYVPPCDLFHATDYVLPPLRRARTVLTIYDLTFHFFPEHHQPLNRWYLSLMLPPLARRADALIAISESTRRDMTRWLGIPAASVAVIPLGVNAHFRPIQDAAELARVRARYDLPARFILYLGTIEPRKNLLTLLDAYRALVAREDATPPLAIAGRAGWRAQPVFARVRAYGLERRVRFCDWIAEMDEPALLSAATVFVYPSFYEGFGLPPLEAMACGAPVICSNASSLPEVVADAGILFDPHNAAALADALARVLSDERLCADLRARGWAQARRFTWERAARATLAVYQKVLNEPQSNRD